MGYDRPGAIQCTGEIQVNHSVPVLVGQLAQANACNEPTGVIDEDVYVSKHRGYLGDNSIHVLAVTRVHPEGNGSSAESLDRGDGVRVAVLVIRHGDIGSTLGQRERDASPNPDVAAGDDRRAIGQI